MSLWRHGAAIPTKEKERRGDLGTFEGAIFSMSTCIPQGYTRRKGTAQGVKRGMGCCRADDNERSYGKDTRD